MGQNGLWAVRISQNIDVILCPPLKKNQTQLFDKVTDTHVMFPPLISWSSQRLCPPFVRVGHKRVRMLPHRNASQKQTFFLRACAYNHWREIGRSVKIAEGHILAMNCDSSQPSSFNGTCTWRWNIARALWIHFFGSYADFFFFCRHSSCLVIIVWGRFQLVFFFFFPPSSRRQLYELLRLCWREQTEDLW